MSNVRKFEWAYEVKCQSCSRKVTLHAAGRPFSPSEQVILDTKYICSDHPSYKLPIRHVA